jgi:ethanolamine utilization protein EutN
LGNCSIPLPNYSIIQLPGAPVQLARVIGDVVATRKDEQLSGLKLLIVQPLSPDHQPVGRPLVAVDAVGAGVGEEVFFVRGKEASFPFHPAEPPVDAGIVGIVDHWDLEEK